MMGSIRRPVLAAAFMSIILYAVALAEEGDLQAARQCPCWQICPEVPKSKTALLKCKEERDKPIRQNWIDGPMPSQKIKLIRWLMTGSMDGRPKVLRKVNTTVPYDGWNHNVMYPRRGSVGESLFSSRSVNGYEDGMGSPSGYDRPNPLNISQTLFKGDPIINRLASARNAMQVFFGQFVADEIINNRVMQCPLERMPIEVPKDHPYRLKYNQESIPFYRAAHDPTTGEWDFIPRQQVNQATSWIDGSAIYGNTKLWAGVLRTQHFMEIDPDGLLAGNFRGDYPEYNYMRLPIENKPPPVNASFFEKKKTYFPLGRLFQFGDIQAHEQPALMSIALVWFRWHNILAMYLRKEFPKATGEEIFQEARKWVVATYQNIIFYEWLPNFLQGKIGLSIYKGYEPMVSPSIEKVFAAVSMRIGHTLIPRGLNLRYFGWQGCKMQPFSMRRTQNSSKFMRLCNAYWHAESLFKEPIRDAKSTYRYLTLEDVIMGLTVQPAEQLDNFLVDDVREYLYGSMDFIRTDLGAIDIQRGRDFGLASYTEIYNFAARMYDLKPKEIIKEEDFYKEYETELKKEEYEKLKEKWEELFALYGDIHNIDMYVGSLMRSQGRLDSFLQHNIATQFERLRDGDSYWFENIVDGLFTNEEACRIKQITFFDILIATTTMVNSDMRLTDGSPLGSAFVLPWRDDAGDFQLHINCNKTLVEYKDCKVREYTYQCLSVGWPNETELEPCAEFREYKFGQDVQVDIIVTLLCYLLIIVCDLCILQFAVLQRRGMWSKRAPYLKGRLQFHVKRGRQTKVYIAMEYVGREMGSRSVLLYMNHRRKGLEIWATEGGMLRFVGLGTYNTMQILMGQEGQYASILIPMHYDVVLQFATPKHTEEFIGAFVNFLDRLNIQSQVEKMSLSSIMSMSTTFQERQEEINYFCMTAYSLLQRAYDIPEMNIETLRRMKRKAYSAKHIHLTRGELADLFGIKEQSAFMDKIFYLFDRKNENAVSLQNFLDVLVFLSVGSAEKKASIMFTLHDTKKIDFLDRKQFVQMIQTLAEAANTNVNPAEMPKLVEKLLETSRLDEKEILFLEDFLKVLGDNKDFLGYAYLDIGENDIPDYMLRKGFHAEADRRSENSFTSTLAKAGTIFGEGDPVRQQIRPELEVDEEEFERFPWQMTSRRRRLQRSIIWFLMYLYHRLPMMLFLTFFVAFVIGICLAEVLFAPTGFSSYRIGLRGTGASLSFLLGITLIPVCRNLITALRESLLSRTIPADMAIDFHKFISFLILIFSVAHIICGMQMVVHQYAMSSDHELSCLTGTLVPTSEYMTTYTTWMTETIPGVSSIVMFFILSTMYIFSMPHSRTLVYRYFWMTHNLYPIFYLSLMVHVVTLLEPLTVYSRLMILPVGIYCIDYMTTLSNSKRLVYVEDVAFLPSNTMRIRLRRPPGINFKSGQYVKVGSLAMNPDNLHPFYVSSPPEARYLDLYINVVGPWTFNLRTTYGLVHSRGLLLYPRLRMEGPYGTGLQNWNCYHVVVLVANEMGIIPFLSIIKEMIYCREKTFTLYCDKIYLLWTTESQRSFEWVTDILRELEESDKYGLLSIHIFITQSNNKFSWRTIMVYLCERHFQKSKGRSLFTGLRAVTHFRPPSYRKFLLRLKEAYPHVHLFGVLYAGDMMQGMRLQRACTYISSSSASYSFHM